MMPYYQWIAWLSSRVSEQRIEEIRAAVVATSGRTGRAHAWTTLYYHARRQGKTFTLHLIPVVQP